MPKTTSRVWPSLALRFRFPGDTYLHRAQQSRCPWGTTEQGTTEQKGTTEQMPLHIGQRMRSMLQAVTRVRTPAIALRSPFSKLLASLLETS